MRCHHQQFTEFYESYYVSITTKYNYFSVMVMVLHLLLLHIITACKPYMCDALSWLGPLSPSSVDQ